MKKLKNTASVKMKAKARPAAKKTGKASVPAKARMKPKKNTKSKSKTKPTQKKSSSSASRRHKKGRPVLCEFCGKTIPAERLEILPETTTCVECSQTQPYSEAEIIGFNLGENTEKEGIDMEDFEDTAPEASPLFDN
ncbi:TraR/DksA C4-type zinc finger protein [bacterium]|nr:TraR/DksA C4-type zinc finger protein [bacterium]